MRRTSGARVLHITSRYAYAMRHQAAASTRSRLTIVFMERGLQGKGF